MFEGIDFGLSNLDLGLDGTDSSVLTSSKAKLQVDAPSKSANQTLDALFGTVSKGLDLWGQWGNAKAANTAAKNNLPSTVVLPTAGAQPTIGGIPQKTLVIGGGIAAAVVLLLVVIGRRR